METLVVVTKVKSYIKSKFQMNTSSSFVEELSKSVHSALNSAIDQAKSANRKTVMGRDFNFYVDAPTIEDNLVVVSKIKKSVKETSGLSTSSQVPEQLTVQVQKICDRACETAQSAKRKTVMDRDITSQTQA